jgi:transcriptional regulator with XRE-family HTH domain
MPRDASTAVGQLIRTARTALHLRQASAARRIGISDARLCTLEQGDAGMSLNSLPTLRRVAVALDIEPAHMLEAFYDDLVSHIDAVWQGGTGDGETQHGH